MRLFCVRSKKISFAIALLLISAGSRPAFADQGVPGTQGSNGKGIAVSSSGADYVLQPFDLIKLEVFQEPDLERQMRISQECSVTIPLIGTVSLKNKTVRQAQDLIRTLYDRDYLVNPQINLIVMEYSKRLVSVLGAVNTANSVQIPPDQPLTLIDAIAGAGGFSRVADRRHVKLTRLNDDGKSITYDINADDIIKSASGEVWELKKGDVVYVPERVM